MVIKISPQLLRLEENENYIGACDYAYFKWFEDRTNKEKLLSAIMEVWLVINWYVPSYEEFRSFNLNLNITRLQQAGEAALLLFSDDYDVMAILGYCMTVQPFWFIGTSAGEDPDFIIAFGRELMKKALDRKPDDPIISAMNKVQNNPAELVQMLQAWDRGWIRDYFISVLITSDEYKSNIRNTVCK